MNKDHKRIVKAADPTKNAMLMVSESAHRLDDLRHAETRRIDDLAHQREHYGELLAIAEAKRLDANRLADMGAVALANERAIAQAAVLAKQVLEVAETGRTLVATTAKAQSDQQTLFSDQIGQRFTLLDTRISLISQNQTGSENRGKGRSDLYGWFIAAIVGVVAVVSYIGPHLK